MLSGFSFRFNFLWVLVGSVAVCWGVGPGAVSVEDAEVVKNCWGFLQANIGFKICSDLGQESVWNSCVGVCSRGRDGEQDKPTACSVRGDSTSL